MNGFCDCIYKLVDIFYQGNPLQLRKVCLIEIQKECETTSDKNASVSDTVVEMEKAAKKDQWGAV